MTVVITLNAGFDADCFQQVRDMIDYHPELDLDTWDEAAGTIRATMIYDMTVDCETKAVTSTKRTT